MSGDIPAPDRADAAQSFYTRWTGLYDLLARRTPGVPRLRSIAIDALDPAPGDRVVDLGCGTGANLPHLRERVGAEGEVVGVDFAPGAVEWARRQANAWENVHVLRGDATRPPLESADAVLATFLVGMLPDPAATVGGWLDDLSPDRVALLDLASSVGPAGTLLNPAFRAFVSLSAPPGTGTHHGESPARILDRRVAAAHRMLVERCDDARHERRAFGFAYCSAGHP
jgi:SAM-dependent methyltransferase